MTFADPADYDLIGPKDRISVVGLANLAPNLPVTVVVTAPDGDEPRIVGEHTYSAAQIEWFKAGSALNLIRERSGN